MYILRTDRLSELTGATYVDFTAYRFKQATIEFVQKALARADFLTKVRRKGHWFALPT